MARRSDNTRPELKDMAVSAGVALLEEGGIDALSARAIAQRIGYTVGTLYNVFDDLEDIVLHINAQTLREMCAYLAHHASAKRKQLPRLKALAQAYGRYAAHNSARWGLLHASKSQRPIPAWYAAEVTHAFAMVEHELLSTGKLSARQAHTASRVLWAGLHGICALGMNQKLANAESIAMDALIEHFVGHYLSGLGVR